MTCSPLRVEIMMPCSSGALLQRAKPAEESASPQLGNRSSNSVAGPLTAPAPFTAAG
jgi:hypothetical protein